MVEGKNWFVNEFDDYVFVEKSHFAVGLALVELVFQWPLALANLYAVLAGKSWYNTTCLVHGATYFTTMVTVLTEITGSGKASNKLLLLCYPLLGFTVLSMLRGLLPPLTSATSTATATKKKRNSHLGFFILHSIGFLVSQLGLSALFALYLVSPL